MDHLARRVALRFSTAGQQSRYTAKELLSKTLDVLGQVESLEEYAFEADDARAAGSDHKKAAEFNELKHIFREVETPLEKAIQLLQRMWRGEKGEKLATKEKLMGSLGSGKTGSNVNRIATHVKTAGEVSEALKKALGEIDYLPNAVQVWLSAHGQNKSLASENAKKLRQAEALLGEVLASLPAGKEYDVNGIGKFMTVDHLIKGLAQHGIKHTGFSDRGGRPEMRGAPTFDKLVGPIYGGPGVVLYETQATYDRLSR